MAMSIADTGYNVYKSIKDPTASNWADTGLTALGILPGFGSVKDTKTALKAGSTLVKNSTKAGVKEATKKTLTRRAVGRPKTKLNTLDKEGNIVRSTRVPYFDNNTVPQAAVYTLGTLGNWAYSVQDALSGTNYLWDNNWSR